MKADPHRADHLGVGGLGVAGEDENVRSGFEAAVVGGACGEPDGGTCDGRGRVGRVSGTGSGPVAAGGREPAGRLQIPGGVAGGRGPAGKAVQRREPVMNTRTPEGGCRPARGVQRSRASRIPARCRGRGHAPGPDQQPAVRPAACSAAWSASMPRRKKSYQPACRHTTGGIRPTLARWSVPASTGRPGRDGSTPGTTAPAARSARCRRRRQAVSPPRDASPGGR